jgi:hypothetical protein
VLDPFMLPWIAEEEASAIPDLVRRIQDQEFDRGPGRAHGTRRSFVVEGPRLDIDVVRASLARTCTGVGCRATSCTGRLRRPYRPRQPDDEG